MNKNLEITDLDRFLLRYVTILGAILLPTGYVIYNILNGSNNLYNIIIQHSSMYLSFISSFYFYKKLYKSLFFINFICFSFYIIINVSFGFYGESIYNQYFVKYFGNDYFNYYFLQIIPTYLILFITMIFSLKIMKFDKLETK